MEMHSLIHVSGNFCGNYLQLYDIVRISIRRNYNNEYIGVKYSFQLG